MANFNLKTIQQNSLAKYLQDDIKKKVTLESWKDWSKEPNQPIKTMKIKKTDKNLLWWINFSKNLTREFLP